MVEVGIGETGVSVGDEVMVKVGVVMEGGAVAVGVADGIDGGKGGSSDIFVGVGVDIVGVNAGGSVPFTTGIGGEG